MTNSGTVLADSVAYLDHVAAFDLLVKNRFSEMELDAILVYLIDYVTPGALPYLAKQFDVLGHKGMRLADTEQQQREIIKQAIELHRYKGTPWAVKQSLQSIGYGDAELIEGLPDHWAKFRISLDLGDKPLGPEVQQDLVKMIYEYKNARSHLEDVSYSITSLEDSVTLKDSETDAQALDDNSDTLFAGGDYRHNGKFYRNGTRNYSRDADVLELTIISV